MVPRSTQRSGHRPLAEIGRPAAGVLGREWVGRPPVRVDFGDRRALVNSVPPATTDTCSPCRCVGARRAGCGQDGSGRTEMALSEFARLDTTGLRAARGPLAPEDDSDTIGPVALRGAEGARWAGERAVSRRTLLSAGAVLGVSAL